MFSAVKHFHVRILIRQTENTPTLSPLLTGELFTLGDENAQKRKTVILNSIIRIPIMQLNSITLEH